MIVAAPRLRLLHMHEMVERKPRARKWRAGISGVGGRRGSSDMLRMWDALHFTEMGRVGSPFRAGLRTGGMLVLRDLPVPMGARAKFLMIDASSLHFAASSDCRRNRSANLDPSPAAPLASYNLISFFEGTFPFAIFALLLLLFGVLPHGDLQSRSLKVRGGDRRRRRAWNNRRTRARTGRHPRS
jgi:hypothetical protein